MSLSGNSSQRRGQGVLFQSISPSSRRTFSYRLFSESVHLACTYLFLLSISVAHWPYLYGLDLNNKVGPSSYSPILKVSSLSKKSDYDLGYAANSDYSYYSWASLWHISVLFIISSGFSTSESWFLFIFSCNLMAYLSFSSNCYLIVCWDNLSLSSSCYLIASCDNLSFFKFSYFLSYLESLFLESGSKSASSSFIGTW